MLQTSTENLVQLEIQIAHKVVARQFHWQVFESRIPVDARGGMERRFSNFRTRLFWENRNLVRQNAKR